MERTQTARRIATMRRIGWLSVVSMLALALLAPTASSASSFNGAIWTSLANGATVNANIYDNKSDVYLNGGPQNCGNGNGLPDGDYYFQVTDPSGSQLLSQDAIGLRQVTVVNNVIAGNGNGTHLEGTAGCNGGLPVQLMPYETTPNNGGEYSVDLGPKADVEDCPGFSAGSLTLNFLSCASTKNDNFKVRLGEPAIAIDKVANPTEMPAGGGSVTYTYMVTNPGDTALSDVSVSDDKCSPVNYVSGDANDDDLLNLAESWAFTCATNITATTTNTAVATGTDGEATVTARDTAIVTVLPPTNPPVTNPPVTNPPVTNPPVTNPPVTNPPVTATPFQSILAETGAPTVTVPPTDSMSGPATPSGESWRMLLVAMAALLAIVLVMTPARATDRRR